MAESTPTDAELLCLIEAHLGLKPRRDDTVIDPRTGRFTDAQRYRDFARAVLAKWGAPPAVEGEPIGYLYCGGSYGDELADWEIVADQHHCDKLNEHHGSLGKEAKLPLYTTPQPTHAQAQHATGAKSFQTYAEAHAYSKGYYAGKKAATQAQAGAVPLTDEQIDELIAAKHFRKDYELKASDKVCINWYRMGLRDGEQAHGIKET